MLIDKLSLLYNWDVKIYFHGLRKLPEKENTINKYSNKKNSKKGKCLEDEPVSFKTLNPASRKKKSHKLQK